MFTGIVEEVGTIKEIKKTSPKAWSIAIHATKVLDDITIGDSISVNGICLTVTHFDSDTFQVDVMPETVKATSLQALKNGSVVNLERAMAANGRFGGHFVSGHVDTIGKITKKTPVENAIYYHIEVAPEWMRYIVPKGSIAVDGTSLTIFHTDKNHFQISLIPHTSKETVLGEKQDGDIVNLECDVLVKSLAHLLHHEQQDNRKSIDISFLQENGFY